MKRFSRLLTGAFAALAALPAAAEVPISDIPLFLNPGDGDRCEAGGGTAAAPAIGGPGADGERLVFRARFDGGDWSGDLSAYPYAGAGAEEGAARWHASEGIPAPHRRAIYTVDAAGAGVAFEWSRLDADARAALGDNEALLAYLRGDRRNEGEGDGEFRPRGGPLGDIVHSAPAFAGDRDDGYSLLPGAEGAGYRDFVLGKAERRDVVLVGANDGMLHVFDADDGSEVFAYVPRFLLDALPALADRDYEHRYYVDGSPAVADAFLGGSWRTVAVTALGRGGPGVFALEVTEPGALGAESVLWEISPGRVDAGDYLGTAMGTPAVVRTESGDWVAIFGNGYNSAADTAALIVADLATGEVLRVLDTGEGGDNGLAAPAAVDRDRDGSVDTVYAGDLKGNLWKFDLSGDRAGDWSVAYGGEPLFTAMSAGGVPQPITVRPDATVSPHGGLMVVFGTGRYLGAPDLRDTATQSVYGIWDVEGAAGAPDDEPVAGPGALRRRSVVRETEIGGTGVRVLDRGPVDYAGDDARRGWVFDLSRPGERIVRDATVFDGKAILVSATPGDDPCAFGGDGALIELDPVTGTQFEEPVLDLSGDGRFGREDGLAAGDSEESHVYPGMVDIDVGLAAVPRIMVREDGDHEKRIAGTGADTRTIREKGFTRPGRVSWQQLR